MKTIEMKLYTFEDLSDKAKETAIKDHRDINTDHDWYELTLDMFSSQFGVVIKSFDLYRREIELDFKYDLVDSCQNFIYEFNNNSIAKIAKEYLDSVDAQLSLDEIDEEMLEDMRTLFIKDLEQEVLSWLDNEYEYLSSEDAIAETLIANEYEFTGHGKRFDL